MGLKTARHLPQSEAEWLETNEFDVGITFAQGEVVRIAETKPAVDQKHLVVMIGGIPRDPERQASLPLINRLHGKVACQLVERGFRSLIFNQPGTGQSSGDVSTITIADRVNMLAELTLQRARMHGAERVSLLGMSMGSYVAARSITLIESAGIEVAALGLQSPAAYPQETEQLAYGDAFRLSLVGWNYQCSPAVDDVQSAVKNGSRLLITFFEKDDPPIPMGVQSVYVDLATDLQRLGYPASTLVIGGVEHNFRRFGTCTNRNIVDNDSVLATANTLTDFLSEAA